jgi:hypothetical protein
MFPGSKLIGVDVDEELIAGLNVDREGCEKPEEEDELKLDEPKVEAEEAGIGELLSDPQELDCCCWSCRRLSSNDMALRLLVTPEVVFWPKEGMSEPKTSSAFFFCDVAGEGEMPVVLLR